MSDSGLQEIKDRLDIVDLISGYIPLKKAGVNYKAACPFHHEKSPSLVVSPPKQIWHCFGCGAGGDAIGFVMQYENLGFKEALQMLADKLGVKLPQYTGGVDKDEKARVLRINTFAAKFYEQLLTNLVGAHARAYLAKRDIRPETINLWHIGFAPNEYHALESALASKGVLGQDLVQAGVAVKNEQGQIYDRFRNRIMFPIHNYFGEIVGFTARILEDAEGAAKYINSPETIIYNKSAILFGLYMAKKAIRSLDLVVVVEGQMDCISLHQAGFTNVVATSGTALTGEHIKLLGRLTRNIYFCFDSDPAGRNAARKAGELALKSGIHIKMITLVGVKDPDELMKKDHALWQQAVESAEWLIDFLITQGLANFDFNSVEQKKFVTTDILPLLWLLTDPVEQAHYAVRLTQAFSIPAGALKTGTIKHTQQLAQEAGPVLTPPDPSLLLEKELLGAVLLYPKFRDFILPYLDTADIHTPEVRELLVSFLSNPDSGLLPDIPLVKEARFMVEYGQLEGATGSPVTERELEKNFLQLMLLRTKEQLQHKTSDIKRAEAAGNAAAVQQLNTQFAQLTQRRMECESLLSSF